MKKTEKIIFLDRDGVINKYPGDRNYVKNLKEFKFLRGSLTAIRMLSNAGFNLYVISNQAGVSKKLYSKKTLDLLTRYMLKNVNKAGGKIRQVLYCTHSKDADCECRKPNTGLLDRAVKGKKIDLARSYFIGDSIKDVQAGRRFGCKTILVLSGREKLNNAPNWETAPDFIAKSLSDAAKKIVKKKYERA